MAIYKFKLISSVKPEVRGRKVITDSNVGGTKNTYAVYRMRIRIGKIYLYRQYIGEKTFLRPYQSVWNKDKNRLPAVYWGKGPLLNMIIVLPNDYVDFSKVKNLLSLYPSTRLYKVKLFNIQFQSHILFKNLKRNQTFYQSNFTKSYDTEIKQP